MAALNTPSGLTLGGFLDNFIPKEMIADTEHHRRARMFMISHVFGPILGASLPVYIFAMDIARDFRVLVFFASILSFWIYPPLLKATGRYKLLSFISIQNLTFCVTWACFGFGGMTSPFLPWVLIFPLLAFLYLPPMGWVRNVLLLQIFGNTALLLWVCLGNVPLPSIDMDQLEIIGMISMGSVAIYFAMMALYFAKMFREQREFGRELNALISSSDNLRNLTQAAEQAGAAKANFIASMSHELRTPLNAIIGYSQLLLEEVEEEGDEESHRDLQHVYKSGADLLYLIDHILDYSRIDAGKMPLNRTYAGFADSFEGWQKHAAEHHPNVDLRLARPVDPGLSLVSDWSALGSIIQNIVAGHAAAHGGGRIEVGLGFEPDRNQFDLRIRASDAEDEAVHLDLLNELFDGAHDVSASKYGKACIDLALAAKFAQLIGGEIEQKLAADGAPFVQIRFPAVDSPSAAARAA